MNGRAIVLSVLISLANTAALIAAYHAFNGLHTHPRIAMLDIAEIYRLKESEFAALLIKPGASEADRAKAIELARTFGTDLVALTERLPTECNCLVLTKPAVVAGGNSVPDLTPEVKRRFGL